MNKRDRYEHTNCSDCLYSYVSSRRTSLSSSGQVEYIHCKRFPTETEHRPYDWCGEWKEE